VVIPLPVWITGSVRSGKCVPDSLPTIASGLTLNTQHFFVLDRAIPTFLMTRPLRIDHLTTLRQLMETAQHYWDVDTRLRKAELHRTANQDVLATFIEMLQRGTITVNALTTGSQSG
jgi:hypothetical protein